MLRQATFSGPRSSCTQRYGGQPNVFRSIQPEEKQIMIGEHITLEGEEVTVEHAIVQQVILEAKKEDVSCGYQY